MTKDEIHTLAKQAGFTVIATETWNESTKLLETFATLIESAAIKRLSAGAGNPAAWITMWPSPEGGYKPVLHPHSDRPKYGTPLDESLDIFPLYTEPQVAAAVAAERLACAEVCDDADKSTHPADLAATIRNRSST